MSLITLSGMRFYAFHGCFAEEQKIGTQFLVEVAFMTDTSRAQQTDDIADTVNYLEVYRAVRSEMMKPSHLLEHVGDRIAGALLAAFPPMEQVRVKVSKLNPPLGGQLESVSVEIIKDHFRQS